MPKISIIIPVYNRVEFLEQCVRSALTQSILDLEVIVVDDGSIESPDFVLESFRSDARLRVIRQLNAGVANARNNAINISCGEYLHFLDADDWIAPAMLGELLSKLESFPQAGFAYCDVTRIDDVGHQIDDYSVGKSRSTVTGNILPSLLIGGYFPPVCALVRKKVISAVGGFVQNLGGCCDWDLWVRISAAGYEACYLDKRLAYYRVHDNSMSKAQLHMQETAVATLAKNMGEFPAQMAESVHEFIGINEAVITANSSLNKRIGELESYLSELQAGKNWLEGQLHAYRAALEEKERIIEAMQREK